MSLKLYARYNVLAHERILDAVTKANIQTKQSRCLFFDTPHATLVHNAGVTELWLARILNDRDAAKRYHYLYAAPAAAAAKGNLNQHTDGDRWLAHNPPVTSDFSKTAHWVRETSLRAEKTIGELDADFFSKQIEFVKTDGSVATATAGCCFLHLFNHNTHHRGQIHAALCEAGHNDCVLDITAVVPDFAEWKM